MFSFDNVSINIISLKERQDRREAIVANLTDRGFDLESIKIRDATRDDFHGGIGCAKSHVSAILDFLLFDEKDYCLIFEDDFELEPKLPYVENLINTAAVKIGNWDVFLFGGAYAIKIPVDDFMGRKLCKVFESQTTSGYIFRRHYGYKLLKAFLNSVEGLEMNKHVKPYTLIYSRFAIDQTWKGLQRKDRWFCTDPFIGSQIKSYSDIEKKEMDYKGV